MLENTVKISIIIPVYNTQKYIGECLDSLINQTFKEIEIICVDDGSTDNSVEILSEYVKKDRRIKMLQQQNQYAGVARNRGMSIATGEYLLFLDSDDFFQPDMLQILYNKAYEDKSDICICSAREYDNSTQSYINVPGYLDQSMLPVNRPFSHKDISDNIFRFSCDAAWNKLYLHSFIEKYAVQFQECKKGNDLRFTNVTLALATRISTVSDVLINYRVRHGGNLQATYMDKPYTFYDITASFKQELEKYGIYEEVKRGYVNKSLSQCISGLDRLENYKIYAEVFYNIKNTMAKELDIIGYNKDYYDNQYDYKQLKRISRYPAGVVYGMRQLGRKLWGK